MINRLAVATLAAVVLASCAQEQPPVNRVQPNGFDKRFFLGADLVDAIDDPEYYSQATLVDVGYGASQDGLFTSTYAQPLTRVKWAVTEDLLIARLAYERIEGTDGKGAGTRTNDGVVVAAYRIQSHYDVKRQYNPSTGEQTNVIEENSVDRPWFKRQFMRVDWSKNLSTDNYDFDTLSLLGVYGGITYEPLAYAINDPADPDAPHFDEAQGYLDITNKAFAKPQLVDLSRFGAGTMPACMFDADFSGGGAPAASCSPIELTIRQSFRLVTDTDFEPEDWDGQRFQAFGAFTTERKGYARNYGMTDTQWHRFINRHNIWKRSHFYSNANAMTGEVSCFTPKSTPAGSDPHRDLDADGTEDECAQVGRGSRCDVFRQRCTLPFRDRQLQPVVWYYAQGSNPDYFTASAEAVHEWDVALRSAVATARYAECNRTGGKGCAAQYPIFIGQQDDIDDAIALATEVDACRAGADPYGGENCTELAARLGAQRGVGPGVVALAQEPELVVLCHSPVEANDPAACGEARLPASLTGAACNEAKLAKDASTIAICDRATTARLGDLRFNVVNTIAAPQTPSSWGIMVDSNDPLTGEVVAGSVNVWSHVTDLFSQGLVDTARYIKGELATADVTEGSFVRDWASAAEAASRNGSLPKLTVEQRRARIAEMLGKDLSSISGPGPAHDSPVFRSAQKLVHQLEGVRADALAPSVNRPISEARRQRVLGTQTEAALTTPMMQMLAGNARGLDAAAATALSSPFRAAHPSSQRDLHSARELALADRSACIMREAPAPVAMADLSNVLEAKFGPFNRNASKAEQLAHGERIRRYLAHRVHYAVLTHELGHSMGLRHNFVSSSDAFNYRPQYWQLRTDDGTLTSTCGQLDPTGERCVGSRALDPVNANERKNMIGMFMQSSTMDYAGEATQDLLGLGSYDFAAARMFYGDVATVAASSALLSDTPRGGTALGKLDNFGGILGFRYEIGPSPTNTNPIHYSDLQRQIGLIDACREIDPETFKPPSWNEATMGVWHPLLDGLIVSVNGRTTKCRQQPVDFVNWHQLRAPMSSETSNTRSGPAVDALRRVRWPYGFATDRWADLGNLAVYRHDNGADPYELFDFLITQQEVNHIFDNYRRGRQTFSVRSASNRQLQRYNEKLRDAAKGLGLFANIYRDFAQAEGYDFEAFWPYLAVDLFGDNYLAAGIGFDHFAKQLARPQSGAHTMTTDLNGAQVLRSTDDAVGNGGSTAITIPNGATGYFGNVSAGGRPLENALATDKGEYDSEYTVNAGSYYEKAWTAMLMTESVDNFISDSRRDFLDGRYRAVSMADLFPDGYRRWLGNALTGDDALRGPRLATNAAGAPLRDEAGFPQQGIGWVSWWGATPSACFPDPNAMSCTSAPTNSVALEPQISWEQQKFLIAWTLMYLPENQQQTWLNQLGLWELGADDDPGFTNRIELHLPDGRTFIARTYGTEVIMGKTVQKGIGARMLEWGNQLLNRAYVTTPGPDVDGNGEPDWYLPTFNAGKPVVRYDPSIRWITSTGALQAGRPGCNASSNTECTCTSNRACIDLTRYQEVPFFMRQAMHDYKLALPSMRGIY